MVKFTPYEQYTQLKLQGKAPKALRWERLRDRHDNHMACVERLVEVATREADRVEVVSREALSRYHVDEEADLMIAVGGDGTFSRADLPLTNLAATPRPRRGDSAETSRGDAAAATWIFRGDKSR